MSGPYRPGVYPGNAGSPLNPKPQNTGAPSFRTDINRKKTKRWVEAKTVSYDGDDWGDDDEEEEEEDEDETPPAVPSPVLSAVGQSPYDPRIQATNVRKESPVGARSLSRDRVGPVGSSQANSSPMASDPTQSVFSAGAEPSSASAAQSPVFTRPADIYKRMQEERERERRSQESARSRSEAPSQTADTQTRSGPPVVAGPGRIPEVQSQSEQTPLATDPTSPPVIPEVKGMSGFREDFLSPANQSPQPADPVHGASSATSSQDPSLHHNPSLGFRSVVNQAFDVPETPTSTTDGFSRSNSESTSVISPIIGRGGVEGEKTPTIVEEPGEAAAEEASGPPPGFQPGHRRDLTVPDPGNGPAKIPTIAETIPSHHSELGETLAASQEDLEESDDSEVGTTASEAPAASEPPVGHHEDSTIIADSGPEMVHEPIGPSESRVVPTENRNAVQGNPRAPTPLEIPEDQPREIPQIIPSMSTETSPQDMESDRLRKEIIRSLSPDTSGVERQSNLLSAGPGESQDRPKHESTYLPSEYDSYWNEHRAISPTDPLQPKSAVAPQEPLSVTINPNPAAETAPTELDPVSAKSKSSRPGLKKRFSWEETDDSEGDVLEEIPAVPTAPTIQPSALAVEHPTETQPFTENAIRPTSLEVPDKSDTAPETVDNLLDGRSPPSVPEVEKETASEAPPAALEDTPRNSVGSLHVPTSTQSQLQPLQASGPPGAEPSPPAFRQIMEIKSPEEKIKAFNEARQQFALLDSGLSDWIRRSSESLPEHAELLQLNGQVPGGTPARGALPPKAKFPKLSSLGNLSLASTSSNQEGPAQSTYSPGHARRPSGAGVINRQNVEAKGKDLLHSAGVLGGKAGGAARGLFAKGKSKLRGSSGADKGKPSIFGGPRRSLQLSEAPKISDLDSDTPSGVLKPQRYSLQAVPRIPSFKFHGGRSFSTSFHDGVFLENSRSYSLDSGALKRPLISVPEEAPATPRSGTPTFLSRAVTQSDIGAQDTGSLNHFNPPGDLYSAHSNPSGAEISIHHDSSIADPEQETPNDRARITHTGSISDDDDTEAHESTTSDLSHTKTTPASRETVVAVPHSFDRSVIPSHDLTLYSRQAAFPASHGAKPQAREITPETSDSPLDVLNKTHSVSSFDPEERNPPPERRPTLTQRDDVSSKIVESSTNSPRMIQSANEKPSNDTGTKLSIYDNRQLNEDTGLHVSRPPGFESNTVISPAEEGSHPVTRNGQAKTTATETSLDGPVSPPLSQEDIVNPSNYNSPLGRQFSSASSQVSNMSDDEMDRIREKFDEDGLLSQSREASPVRSQVSDMSDDSLDEALRKELGGGHYRLTSSKGRGEQSPERPMTGVQPVPALSVARASSLMADEDGTGNRSRFSFESDRNGIAEAMLVNAEDNRRRTIQTRSREASEGLPRIRIPMTLGEDAPTEPPPPFPDVGTEYGPDKKEEEGETPPYSPTGRSDRVQPSTQIGSENPAVYQSRSTEPGQTPPAYRLSQPTAGRDPTRGTSQIQRQPQSAVQFSPGHVQEPGDNHLNSSDPRERARHSRQFSFVSEEVINTKRKSQVPVQSLPENSRWASVRTSGGPHSQGHSGRDSEGSRNSLGMGKKDEDSMGSGDSMAVHPALSQPDLLLQPSPLVQQTKRAPVSSDTVNVENVAKQQNIFKSKLKFIGKRMSGGDSVPPQGKVADNKAEEKADVSRGKGTLSKIGGFFNRSGPTSQRANGKRADEQFVPPPINPQYDIPWHDSDQTAAQYTQPPLQNSALKLSPYEEWHQQGVINGGAHPAFSRQFDGLPPPPDGYYAPGPTVTSDPSLGYFGPPHAGSPYPSQPTTGWYEPNSVPQWPTYQQNPASTYAPTSPPERSNRSDNVVYSPGGTGHRSNSSYHSQSVTSPASSSGSHWHGQSSPELERGRSRAQDLRLRSRSPRTDPIRLVQKKDQNTNYSDPAYRLGKFNAVPETSRIGDQSLPFHITLPSDLENPTPRTSMANPPTTQYRKSSNLGLGVSRALPVVQHSSGDKFADASKLIGLAPEQPAPTENGTHSSQNSVPVSDAAPPSHADSALSVPSLPSPPVENSTLSSVSAPVSDEASNNPAAQLAPPVSDEMNGLSKASEGSQRPQESQSQSREVNPAAEHPASHPDRYEEGNFLQRAHSPVELPVRSDDSSEEIIMSSTAYPGQSWQPDGFEQWMRY